jgi:bifunctional ADP-heptose synthase (sugar kinase/adenylyltransferase)
VNLDAVADFRVLMVGDAIMDEYRYVRPIGKAVKENALSAMVGKSEVFRGGVWAAAQHALGFCRQVDIMTGQHVMWNTRLVDDVYLRKLFVLHERRENELVEQDYDIRDYDVVIVTDFGHGTLTKDRIEAVSKQARFLAINAQTSSTNFGFNLITKYRRADFVVVDELEARLAAHDKDGPIEDVILALGFKNIIVTMGAYGAVGFDGAFERQPALTDKVVDTMGAGDAFLAVTAPYAAAGFSMKNLIRIGNAAGAIKVGIVGHRGSVDKETLRGRLEH